MVVDWSPEPSSKELVSITSRLRRLQEGWLESAAEVVERTASWPARELRLRPSFVWRSDPPAGDYSDRRVPPRTERPSATRINAGQGSALRLHLTAVARAQAFHKAGSVPTNPLSTAPTRNEVGWTEFLASDATDRTGATTRTREYARHKTARMIQSALKTLEGARLVKLSHSVGEHGRFEDFALLDEAGVYGVTASSVAYRVPTARESTFSLPSGFVQNGWIHLLTDSEINLLLMVACGEELGLGVGFREPTGHIGIPAETRLLQYGIGRDSFTAAHRMLRRFGLIDVVEIDRHADGRSSGDGPPALHRLKIEPAAFEDSAITELPGDLRRQLRRAR